MVIKHRRNDLYIIDESHGMEMTAASLDLAFFKLDATEGHRRQCPINS
jgi:hypothetical protein